MKKSQQNVPELVADIKRSLDNLELIQRIADAAKAGKPLHPTKRRSKRKARK